MAEIHELCGCGGDGGDVRVAAEGERAVPHATAGGEYAYRSEAGPAGDDAGASESDEVVSVGMDWAEPVHGGE